MSCPGWACIRESVWAVCSYKIKRMREQGRIAGCWGNTIAGKFKYTSENKPQRETWMRTGKHKSKNATHEHSIWKGLCANRLFHQYTLRRLWMLIGCQAGRTGNVFQTVALRQLLESAQVTQTLIALLTKLHSTRRILYAIWLCRRHCLIICTLSPLSNYFISSIYKIMATRFSSLSTETFPSPLGLPCAIDVAFSFTAYPGAISSTTK